MILSNMYAVIPARGGSKGLPGKNIKNFLGKPLIAHTIECAIQSGLFKGVVVSTDCEEIRDIALTYGAIDIGLRPKDLSEDWSKAIDVYNYVIDLLCNLFNTKVDNICVLQPTSPLRSIVDLKGAVELFYNTNADSVVSYVQEQHPLTWHKYLDSESKFVDVFSNNLRNRQDERPSFYPNGAIYIFKSELLRNGLYYSERSFAFVMPRNRSVDIDTQDDFDYAVFLAEKK